MKVEEVGIGGVFTAAMPLPSGGTAEVVLQVVEPLPAVAGQDPMFAEIVVAEAVATVGPYAAGAPYALEFGTEVW